MRKRIAVSSLIITIILCLVLLLAGCKREEAIARGPQTKCYSTSGGDKWVCASGGEIELRSGAILAATPGATIVVGAMSSGDQVIAGNVSIAQPTAAATATPMVYGNTAADAPDLLVIAKDATPVVYVHNSGQTEFDGQVNIDDAIDLDGSSDEVQLSVTGYTTQTNDLVQLDGGLVDIGGGTYTVANGDNDLGIAGDVEVEGSVVLASAGYPLEYPSAGYTTWFSLTATFTGTTQILSTTHGCTTSVLMVLCTMNTPDEDAGDPFLCVGSVTDGDVTLTAVQDDGTNATLGDTAYYIIIGN